MMDTEVLQAFRKEMEKEAAWNMHALRGIFRLGTRSAAAGADAVPKGPIHKRIWNSVVEDAKTIPGDLKTMATSPRTALRRSWDETSTTEKVVQIPLLGLAAASDFKRKQNEDGSSIGLGERIGTSLGGLYTGAATARSGVLSGLGLGMAGSIAGRHVGRTADKLVGKLRKPRKE